MENVIKQENKVDKMWKPAYNKDITDSYYVGEIYVQGCNIKIKKLERKIR